MFSHIKLLTFDCYGTLIDWETGILNALRPVLKAHGKHLTDERILETYATLEPKIQQGPYQRYKSVLRSIVAGFGAQFGFSPSPDELDCLSHSIGQWPPFPDTVASLKALKQHYQLAVLSNIDKDLFSRTAQLLETPFDWIITAEDLQSYKPQEAHFRRILEVSGLPRESILHVAQSIYHDIIPAKTLGLQTVWVNRRHRQQGPGATKPAAAQPTQEVPDLQSLVVLLGLNAPIS